MFRAIIFHPSVPILLADNDRRYREAIVGKKGSEALAGSATGPQHGSGGYGRMTAQTPAYQTKESSEAIALAPLP